MTKPYIMGGIYGLALICAAAGGGYYAESYVLKEQGSPLDAPMALQARSGCTDYNVLSIVSSLRQHPEKWQADDYRVYKDSWGDHDIYVWTANEEYGLDIATTSYGNNSANYPFTDQCRALLYKTTEAFKKYDWNRRLK